VQIPVIFGSVLTARHSEFTYSTSKRMPKKLRATLACRMEQKITKSDGHEDALPLGQPACDGV